MFLAVYDPVKSARGNLLGAALALAEPVELSALEPFELRLVPSRLDEDLLYEVDQRPVVPGQAAGRDDDLLLEPLEITQVGITYPQWTPRGPVILRI